MIELFSARNRPLPRGVSARAEQLLGRLGESLSFDPEPGWLPLLPMRELVVLPGQMVPFIIGRPFSINAFYFAMAHDRRLAVAMQRDPKLDRPELEDLRAIGSIVQIHQHLLIPNGNLKVMVEGKGVVRVSEEALRVGCRFARTEEVVLAKSDRSAELALHLEEALEAFNESDEGKNALVDPNLFELPRDPARAAYLIAGTAVTSQTSRQSVLECATEEDLVSTVRGLLAPSLSS